MYTIRAKLLVLALVAALPLAAVLGGIGLININKLESIRAAEGMTYIVEDATVELDKLFIRAEDVVHHVASAVKNNIEDPRQVKNRLYRNYIKRYLLDTFTDAASSIGQVATFYVYFSDKLTKEPDGFWCIRDKENGTYKQHELTSIKKYGRNSGRTAWYYEPVIRGKPVWLTPYMNENIGLQMISYTMPVKVKGSLVAVVGVDIDFSILTDVVKNLKVLGTGYGFLSAELGLDELYVHPEYPYGTKKSHETIYISKNADLVKERSSGGKLISYTYKGQEREMVFTTLQNGMKMVVTAPHSETYVTRYKALWNAFFALLLITTVVMIIVISFSRKITEPLNDIKEAARRMGDGDYDFTLKKTSNDELGDLTDCINDTISRLQSYVSTIRKMAFTDDLTGVKNRSSYDGKIAELNAEIADKKAEFAVVMIDLNNLKFINDNYGHEKGNLAIINVCRTVCNIFKHSPVYRIGGDEFVVILEHSDYKNREILISKLLECVDSDHDCDSPWECFFVAVGSSKFHPSEDFTYIDVFRRADKRMYKCKKKQKGEPSHR